MTGVSLHKYFDYLGKLAENAIWRREGRTKLHPFPETLYAFELQTETSDACGLAKDPGFDP